MRVEHQLLLFWVLFAGSHLLGSSAAVRARLISGLGLWGFKVTYSLVALATLTPLVLIYWNNRHEGELLFEPDRWAVRVTELIMLPAAFFLVMAFATSNPATTHAELRRRFVSSPKGIHRITRHPMNTAFGLFGLAHMVSNPTVGDWIFWGGFLVYAVVSAVHQDRRTLASGPDAFRAFYQETSIVPFVAILQGRQRLALRELRWSYAAGALLLFAVVRWIHPRWIGGFG